MPENRTVVEKGLSTEEANRRREEHGENRIEEQKKRSMVGMFAQQLCDPLIYVLMAAIVISLFLKEAGEALIIATVILLNACVGVIQEGKANKAIEALKQLSCPQALVFRDGVEAEIPGTQLVPGDVIVLEAGRFVPADAVLLTMTNLQVDEAALTGESIPVLKEKPEEPVYMSTMVTMGRGEALVTHTGMHTQIGQIAGMIEQRESELTPLQKRLTDLGKLLSILAVSICLLLFVVALLQKRDIGDMLLTAISLAVAAVPEGLAAVVTIVLALGVSRMVKVNTIVRKLPSVETLGAVNVVCSDKTGTLTQNRMTVKEYYLDGTLYTDVQTTPAVDAPLLLAMTLCNNAHTGEQEIGDPTELALLHFAKLCGTQIEETQHRYIRTGEREFDSVRKRMTVSCRLKDETRSFTKGAADELLICCSRQLKNGRKSALTERQKKDIRQKIEEMSKRALRVLAFAMKEEDNLLEEENLIFLGLVGMIDPPREDAAQAVSSFTQAHVDTVMITGDHVDTALAIARKLEIATAQEQCMKGEELEQLSEEALLEKLDTILVFARVTPAHKVRIVEGLKKQGKIVAMTGDGINDAPSLKAADVGIAMGKSGTDVARNAADLILTDDNFASIEKAIREGRGIYENIRKTILFLLSSNFGEILTMLVTVIAGLPVALKASHILWVNLITDSLPALALGMDQNDKEELMRMPPRKNTDSMFSHGGLSCTLCYGVIIGVISLLAFLTVPYQALLSRELPVTFHSLFRILQLEEVLTRAQTHAFTVLSMSQLMHAIGMKDVNQSIFKMKHLENTYMLFALGIGFFLQIMVTEIPYFVSLFHTSLLSLREWGLLLLLSLVPLLVHELLFFFTEAVKSKE